MWKKIISVIIIIIVDYTYLLPWFKKSAGNILGFILNTLFLIIVLFLFSIYYFYPYINKFLIFVAEKLRKKPDDIYDYDIDYRDLENLKRGPIDLKSLSSTSDNKGIILTPEEDLIVDPTIFQFGRKSQTLVDENQLEGDFDIENQKIESFYNKFCGLNIKLNSSLNKFFLFLLSTLDKYGDRPSLVDLNVVPNDPDMLKRNIYLSSFGFDLYPILRLEVDLMKHSINTADLVLSNKQKLMEKIKNDKIFKSAEIEPPELDDLNFVFTIFAALAHDIGKVPNFNGSDSKHPSKHPLASAEFIENYFEYYDNRKYKSYIKQLVYAVENHHNSDAIENNIKALKINNSSDKEKDKNESFNIILFYLYYADINERLNEVNTLIKNRKKMQTFFGANE
jgi:hypothetical protein